MGIRRNMGQFLLLNSKIFTLFIYKQEDNPEPAVIIKAAVAESKPFVAARENSSNLPHLAA